MIDLRRERLLLLRRERAGDLLLGNVDLARLDPAGLLRGRALRGATGNPCGLLLLLLLLLLGRRNVLLLLHGRAVRRLDDARALVGSVPADEGSDRVAVGRGLSRRRDDGSLGLASRNGGGRKGTRSRRLLLLLLLLGVALLLRVGVVRGLGSPASSVGVLLLLLGLKPVDGRAGGGRRWRRLGGTDRSGRTTVRVDRLDVGEELVGHLHRHAAKVGDEVDAVGVAGDAAF